MCYITGGSFFGGSMGAGDRWGKYKTPCPKCRGVVEYWSFDSDCRGNDASGGIQCKKCKKTFTEKEWLAIAREEFPGGLEKLEKAEREEKRRKEKRGRSDVEIENILCQRLKEDGPIDGELFISYMAQALERPEHDIRFILRRLQDIKFLEVASEKVIKEVKIQVADTSTKRKSR